ncbi:MAG: DUF4124 domain-containing protein [Gammaproteobacteria bacterium]|nr:DUF4124 domain-containing protein [Gammaproteobacteria bacterium]
MKNLTLTLLLGSLLLAGQAGATKIKKCQDEDGMWHYGDRAAAACAKSKIIEMNTDGTKTGEVAAPPTVEELKVLEEQQKRDEERKKAEAEQARQDALLLSIYGHEKDIIYVRDRKIAQVEHSITANKETLTTLEKTLERQQKQKVEEDSLEHTRSQINRVKGAIDAKRVEQKDIEAHYNKELVRYREIKASQAAAEKLTAPEKSADPAPSAPQQ